MKYERHAQKRGVPMKEAIGRIKLTVTTDVEARILAMLYEALIEGHPIELPHRDIVIGSERVGEGAELVGNDPAETAAVDVALKVGVNDAKVGKDDPLEFTVYDAEEVRAGAYDAF